LEIPRCEAYGPFHSVTIRLFISFGLILLEVWEYLVRCVSCPKGGASDCNHHVKITIIIGYISRGGSRSIVRMTPKDVFENLHSAPLARTSLPTCPL
jgi:hypothetical protein